MDDTIKQRMLKIKALVEGGQEHEAKVAREMLDRHMKKYGISEADLSEFDKVEYEFKYSALWEKKLLGQLHNLVTGNSSCFSYSEAVTGKRIRRKLGFSLTRAEFMELMVLYDHYKAEYKKDLEGLYVAFLYKHNLLGKTENPSECTISPEEIAKLLGMARGLGSQTLRREKQLEYERKA